MPVSVLASLESRDRRRAACGSAGIESQFIANPPKARSLPQARRRLPSRCAGYEAPDAPAGSLRHMPQLIPRP